MNILDKLQIDIYTHKIQLYCHSWMQVPLVDRVGRRLLLLYPMGLMAISLLGAFVSILLIEFKFAEFLSFLAIGFIVLFIVGFGPGLGNLPGVDYY